MKASKLFIESISLTYPIKKKSTKARIAKQLNKLMKHKNNFWKGKYTRGHVSGYFQSYQYTLLNNRDMAFNVDISINPMYENNHFIRIALNPNMAGIDGMRSVYKLLVMIMGHSMTNKIYFRAPITRLDISMDIYNLNCNYYAHVSGKTYSKVVFLDDEEFNQIIGKGRVRLCVYHKPLTDYNHAPNAANNINNCMRYEFRLRDLRFPLSELAVFRKNPFIHLSLYNERFLKDDYFDSHFIEAVKNNGLSCALSLLPNNAVKRRYKYRLNKHHKASWLKPEQRWENWEQATTIFDNWRN